MAMQTGRAAVLAEFGADFEIREFPVPEPEPGGLIVATECSSVCGTDVHAWEGALAGALGMAPPVILGHEVVGRVVAIGAGADIDSAGDVVAVGDRLLWSFPTCGHCYECTVARDPARCPHREVGLARDCSVPPHFTGAFADYGYVSARSERIRVPEQIPSRWAAAASCALRTVVAALPELGPIDYLDSVVVQGAGPIGLFATALLATHSPRQLIVVGGPPARLALARAWGATHTVAVDEHATPDARRDAILSITGTRGPSAAVEASGAPGAVAEGVAMLGPSARYVIVGTLGGGPQSIDAPRITTRGLQLRGSMGTGIDAYWKALRFLDQFRERFDWDALFGREYPLTGVRDALIASRDMDEIKPLVVPGLR